ncbi:hypothetical protein K488DRAFT_58139 [Vararia minispora EC-137]|uniref:Uncharacterized protein n=1 Tax=Vararia minispora EC-137 TaxID=1314806 RepID=A0ACB8QAI9_9AGAM|nr:hypothetical protein K488DRAFT_58139 [Vararia minispora EC-137]
MDANVSSTAIDSPKDTPKDASENLEALYHTCDDSAERLEAIDFARNLTSVAEIYWSPGYLAAHPPDSSSLPDPDFLNVVSTQLGTSLCHKVQRDALNDPEHPPVEHILTLYCPIEGGDYVIDNTVRELARRSKADVVVLDVLHLAAGKNGRYGSTGALLNFSDNPLYKRAPSTSRSRYSHYLLHNDSDDDCASEDIPPPPSSGTPHSPRFAFDLLVNITTSATEPAREKRRPRIIYVRDFPTLSSSLGAWWPELQSAVQLRRRSTSASSSAPIENRTVIVIGATPAGTSAPRYCDEDGKKEDSNREESFRRTMKKWAEGDDDPLNEVACLRSKNFRSALRNKRAGTVFLRKTFLVPATRAPDREKMMRVARRQEINTFLMRSAAAACGAFLPDVYSAQEGDTMWCEWGKQRFPWQVMCTIVGFAVGDAEVAAMERVLEDGLDEEWSAPLSLSWDDIRGKWGVPRMLRDKRTSWTQDAEEDEKEDEDTEDDEDTEEDDEEKEEEKEKEEKGETKNEDEVVKRVKNADDLSRHEKSLLVCIVDLASTTTTFDDVLLPPETIDAVRTVASLHLLHPAAFEQGILKQHGMKGLLLFGPPGVGKTHVVRALAKECGARMLSVQPSHIIDMWLGESEKRVRAVFSLARRLSPCVMFIDELDAMFSERAANSSSASKAYRAIVTEFLQEMDGISSKRDNVIVVGATNRPFDLDDAVLRRLPLRIMVELPGEIQREEILKIHLRDEQVDDDVDVKRLAKLTDRFSGSDLKDLVVSAALDATKESIELPWKKAVKPFAEDASSSSDTLPVPAETPGIAPKVTSTETPAEPTQTQDDKLTVPSNSEAYRRILHWRNFVQALTEIWPSASEHLGTYAKLRHWNDKFGSGGRKRDEDDVKGDPEVGNHEGVLAKVRRAFDLSDTERLLLKCAVDPGASLLVSYIRYFESN